MVQEFLNRALPIFTEAGFQILRNKVVAFAGLGGVGGVSVILTAPYFY